MAIRSVTFVAPVVAVTLESGIGIGVGICLCIEIHAHVYLEIHLQASGPVEQAAPVAKPVIDTPVSVAVAPWAPVKRTIVLLPPGIVGIGWRVTAFGRSVVCCRRQLSCCRWRWRELVLRRWRRVHDRRWGLEPGRHWSQHGRWCPELWRWRHRLHGWWRSLELWLRGKRRVPWLAIGSTRRKVVGSAGKTGSSCQSCRKEQLQSRVLESHNGHHGWILCIIFSI